jgi:hypothetical protein
MRLMRLSDPLASSNDHVISSLHVPLLTDPILTIGNTLLRWCPCHCPTICVADNSSMGP